MIQTICQLIYPAMKLVEVRGVEPLSCEPSFVTSTRLVGCLFLAWGWEPTLFPMLMPLLSVPFGFKDVAHGQE